MFLAATVRVGASLWTSILGSTLGFSPEGPEGVLGISPKAQSYAVRNPCLGEVRESLSSSRETMAAEAFLHMHRAR